MKNLSRNLLIVVGLLTVGGAVLALRSRPKWVVAVPPISMKVTETIAASGRLRGETESSIGASNGGRVAAVFVREGEKVKARQIIARMDSEVFAAQVDQAQMAVRTAQRQITSADAAIQTAQAQVQLAARPPLTSDMERLRADTDQSVLVAKAKLASAKQRQTALYQRYLEVKNGVRREEIEQAQAQALQAEINQGQLERDWKRQQALYQKEVIARIEMERAETNYLVGKQILENARARLQQLQAGSRSEQIAQAQADYLAACEEALAAEASLHGAQRSGKAQMQSLLAMPRLEDVAVAKQRLQQEIQSREVAMQRFAEARSALALAQQRYAEMQITAPFDGTVTQIVTKAGAIAGPNAPVVRLVRTSQPEIHVDLDESNLGKLRPGQEALITNDAFPDARFKATVSAIGAQVDTERGTVEVRLKPIAPPDWVRPGQTFTVNIALGEAQEQLVVPISAINTMGGVSSLLVVENNRAVKKRVKAGPLASRGVPILQGISPGAQVITDPTGLLEGDPVLVRKR